MHYLLFYKKTAKNIHGCFVEGPETTALDRVKKDLERYGQCGAGGSQVVDVKDLQPYRERYEDNICYYSEDYETFTIMAGPEVSEKHIKEVKRYLKNEHHADKIEVYRLLLIRNWYPETPFKRSVEQQLIKNVKLAHKKPKARPSKEQTLST